jgi:hypothetical protein
VDLPGALKRMAWLVLPPFFGLRLQGGTYMVRLNFSVFISAFAVGLASAIANASVPNSSTQINVQPRAISASGDCSRVCSNIRSRIKASTKLVEAETDLWRQRLGVKTEVITYPQGFSAAEELLRFMTDHFPSHAPGNQAEPQFLVYLMAKCFPEAYVDLDRARLTGLVETLWTAKNLKVEKEISTCK